MLKIGNLNSLEHKELFSKSGEALSFSAVLTDLPEHKGIFIHHEIIPAGRRSSSPHLHTKLEEFVVVLSGKIRAHFGERFIDLRECSYTTFFPGRQKHFLENVSDSPASCLVICSRPEGDEVFYS